MPTAELRLRLALVAGLLSCLPAMTYVRGPLISTGVLVLVLFGAFWKFRKKAPRTVAVLLALLVIPGAFVWTSLAHVLVSAFCTASAILALSVLVPLRRRATTVSG